MLNQLTRNVLETALEAELTEHLGHERGQTPITANMRNGTGSKIVLTEIGPVETEAIYPVLFVDAVVVKVRDGQVRNTPFYVVMGATTSGEREILGIWAGDGGEGSRFWLQVFSERKNRGVEDVSIAICDGLKGVPEEITTAWVPGCFVESSGGHTVDAVSLWMWAGVGRKSALSERASRVFLY